MICVTLPVTLHKYVVCGTSIYQINYYFITLLAFIVVIIITIIVMLTGKYYVEICV